uniref:Shugoshin_C domain-containing protein n=1 Tax=Heterorhabditis bacteriophora TaxID=37862 RepID=A0A1I7WIX3_HETBA
MDANICGESMKSSLTTDRTELTESDLTKNISVDTSMDCENSANISVSGITESEKMAISAKKETPQAVRTRRHFQQELHMSSPSDSILSPCTSKLFGKGGKKAVSGPTAILRNKQHSSIPFNMSDN